jgi:hypothetical protein
VGPDDATGPCRESTLWQTISSPLHRSVNELPVVRAKSPDPGNDRLRLRMASLRGWCRDICTVRAGAPGPQASPAMVTATRHRGRRTANASSSFMIVLSADRTTYRETEDYKSHPPIKRSVMDANGHNPRAGDRASGLRGRTVSRWENTGDQRRHGLGSVTYRPISAAFEWDR